MGSAEPVKAAYGSGIYETEEMALMQEAMEAVCAEVGIARGDHSRREAVAMRILQSWTTGSRLPLNLVSAGLDGAA